MEELRKAIIAMIEGRIPLNSTWATVKSVTVQTCTITIDELDIENILLGINNSGVIVYPVVNSDVLVMFTDNSKTNGAVVYVKQTDKVEIMGNANGGLVLIANLITQLNNLETAFNNHLIIYNSHVHTGGTISGSTAIPTVVDTNSLTPTVQSDIENTKIKHGNG